MHLFEGFLRPHQAIAFVQAKGFIRGEGLLKRRELLFAPGDAEQAGMPEFRVDAGFRQHFAEISDGVLLCFHDPPGHMHAISADQRRGIDREPGGAPAAIAP